MDLRSIFLANGIGVFILMMLQYMSRARIRSRRTEDKLYSFLLVGVMFGCVMEALSYWLDGRVFPGSRLMNYAANTYLYTVNLLLPFCVLAYVDLGLYGDIGRIRRLYRPQIAVGAAMLALNVLNFFVPIIYYISPQNVYSRRPLSYLFYVVILYFLISAIVTTKRYERENGARAFVSINAFLVPVLVGTGLQFMFYGLSLAWLSAAIGLNGLYLMQQNEAAYTDSLVDTYNRQYMNHILAAWISRGKRFAGVMLDIDRFKYVNDRFGHSEGDNALKAIAGILKAARRDHEWVFRFAGDEFIVLKLTDARDGLSAYMEEVQRRLDAHNRADPPYPLGVSYGESYFESGSIDAFMKEMDERMYAMKAAHHGE